MSYFIIKGNKPDQEVVAQREIKQLVRPQSWFNGIKEQGGVKVGETAAHVYAPSDKEKDLLLKTSPCQTCRFFDLHKGQATMQADRVTQMLMYDLRWTSFVESTDPREYGSCAVKSYALVHRFSTCEHYTPLETAKRVWHRVKEYLSKEKGEGRL